jgi:recombinational DNA repair protein (RecF pathway)
MRRVDPEAAAAEMRAAGVEPLEPYTNTHTAWLCRCMACGRETAPTLGSVRSGHTACAHCAGKAPIDPDEAIAQMRAAGLEPLVPYTDTQEPWRAVCAACGHEVSPRLASIRGGRSGCAYCAGSALTDLRVAVAEMRAAGVEPLEPYANVDEPWRSRCLTCAHEVSPTLASIRAGQGGCRYCAEYGFQHDKPGTLYLIRHTERHALKVGITNDTTQRLLRHERLGWSLVDLWFFDVGADAFDAEQTVLDAWDEYEYAVAAEDMPHGGHTETVSLDDVSEAEAVALIEAATALR